MNYTNQERIMIVNDYLNGTSVSSMTKQYKLSRSTLYNWISNLKEVSISKTNISKNELYIDNVQLKKLKRDNEILTYVIKELNLSTSEKLKLANSIDEKYPVHSICRVLNLRRSTYYHNKYRKPKITKLHKDDEIFKNIIKNIFKESKGRFGARKIRRIIIKDGYIISERRITRLMKEMELVVNQKSSNYNDSHKRKYFTKPNIISKLDSTIEVNMIWISDITYIKVNSVYYYLYVIIDIYSRFIIDYKLSKNMESVNIVKLFTKSFIRRNKPSNLIFHSDQGRQYKSYIFKNYLAEHNVTQSYSKTGCPYDNAVCESTFASLKKEEIYRFIYKNFDELKEAIDEYITYFNFSRPHASLNYLTPSEFENTSK